MFEAINFVKQYETTLLLLFFGTVCLQNKFSHVMTVIFKVVGEEDYQSHANNDHLRINWTREMDCYFIDLMLEQLHRGNKIGRTYTMLKLGPG